MTREEQLKSCTICTHRCMDMHKGLLCGLTQNAANFEGVCPNFEQDEKEAKKQQQIQQEVKNDEVMNDKDQTNYWLLVLCILFYVFGGTIITMLQNMSPLFIFFIALLFGVPAFCFVYKFVENYLVVPYDVRRFEKRVIKLLNKEGYKWERDEGDLYIFKNDSRFLAQCYRMPERPAIRVFFEYTTLDEELKSVSPLGQMVLAAMLTVEETPTRVKDNVIYSVYKADVRNAREFIQEFNSAYERFGAMMQNKEKYLPQMLQIFPVSIQEKQDHKIGF